MERFRFAGKTLDDNEWIEGYYAYKDLTDEHFIVVPTFDNQGSGKRPQYFTDYLVDGDSVSLIFSKES